MSMLWAKGETRIKMKIAQEHCTKPEKCLFLRKMKTRYSWTYLCELSSFTGKNTPTELFPGCPLKRESVLIELEKK